MFRRLLLYTRRSMRTESAGFGSNGARPSNWIYFVVFILCCCIFGPNVAEATYNPPHNCTHTVYKVSGTKFQNVSCTNKDLTAVPSDGKEGSDVIKLDLSNNLIESLNATDFQYLTNLVELILANNPISSMTPDAFSSMTNLQIVDLSENALTALPSGIFTDTNITTLILSASAYMDLTAQLPKSLTITTLDLSNNNIEEIPDTLFDSLPNLNEIDLSNNAITSIDRNTFEQASITKIDLSENRLTEIDFKIDRWDSVISLDLSYNSISDVHAQFLKGSSIQTLDLSFNQFEEIAKSYFDKAATLVELDLSNNQIGELNKDAFDDTNSLKVLDLSNNSITDLDHHIFEKTELLTSLNLSYNSLRSLDDDLFEKTRVLESLDLSHNQLTSLDEDIFSEATALQIVKLGHNSLSTIPASIFDDTPDLTEIYLNNNALTTLPMTLFDQQSEFSGDFSYNSFVCNCDLKDYLYQIYHNANKMILNEDLLKCTTTGGTEHIFLDWDDSGCSKILGNTCTAANECNVRNAECNNDKCKCMSSYYDTNDDTLGGECQGKLPNGGSCSSNLMCNETNAWCNTTTSQCECTSNYYDEGGTCFPKKTLSASCTQSYQCASNNSECASNVCTCKTGYKDFDNSGNCRGPSSMVSCFPFDSSSTQVVFQNSSEAATTDHDCRTFCFPTGARYYLIDSGICLCGKATDGNCCPKPAGQTTCGQLTHVGSSVSHVTAGIVVAPISNVTTGIAYQFTATTNLTLIDQIIVSFGDGVETTSNGGSVAVYHTYTYADNFNFTLSACNKASLACDRVAITVTVQVPLSNLTTFLTSQRYADVSGNLSDILHATVFMGNRFEYYWMKKASGSTTSILKRGCLETQIQYRGQCISMFNTAATQSAASTSCSTTYNGHLLELTYPSEISELITTFGATAPFLTGLKIVGNIIKKTSDNSKSCFRVAQLTDKTAGECIVVNPSTNTITSTSCSTAHPYVCAKDPVDCPKGGTLQSDRHCLVLGSDTTGNRKTWEQAKDYCWSHYGGSLVKIASKETLDNVTDILGSIGEAWIGLSDTLTESYIIWVDGSPFIPTQSYHPSMTQSDYAHDCFVTTSTSSWHSRDCEEFKNFVCEYSENHEWVQVQNHAVGTLGMGIPSGTNIKQVVQIDPFTETSTETEILLFPEHVITGTGSQKRLISFVIKSIAIAMNHAMKISFLIVRPSCTPPQYLIRPGCAGNRYPACSDTATATATPCNPVNCLFNQKPCYLSDTCKFNNQTCTCVSDPVSACNTEGNTPVYTVVATIQITLTESGQHIYDIPAGFQVYDLDFMAVQYEIGQNPLMCSDSPTNQDQTTVHKIKHQGWLRSASTISTVSTTTEDLTCCLQSIIANEVQMNLPTSLTFSKEMGSFDYSITIVATETTKKLTIDLVKAITDVSLIDPVPSNTASGTLGIVYNTLDETLSLTIASDGSDVQAVWSHDSGHITYFTSTCSVAVTSAVGQACNATLYCSATPFTTQSITPTSAGTMTLTITLTNEIGTVTKTVEIQTAQAISGVSLSLVTSVYTAYTVMLNQDIEFSAAAAEGTGLNYEYLVNETRVATSTNNKLTYAFSSVNTFQVKVNVSNIVSSAVFSIIIIVKQPALYTSCYFVGPPYTAATGVALNLQVSCSVKIGAEVRISWYFSSGSSNSTSTSNITTTTTQTWTKSVTFTSAVSSVTVIAILRDDFGTVSINTTFVVYNSIPSVGLSVSKQAISLSSNTSVTFAFSVPVSPGFYGPISFTLNRGDGTSITITSDTTDNYTYTTAGNKTVTLTATNGPSTASNVSYVAVLTPITSCSLNTGGTHVINTVVSFTATAADGNLLKYNFKLANIFDETRSDNMLSYRFTTAGDYNVSVNCSNALSSAIGSVTAIVLATTEIRLTSIKINDHTITGCIEKGKTYTFKVVTIHYDISSLTYDWDWGDKGSVTTAATDSQNKAYSIAGNVTVTVTAKYAAENAQQSRSDIVCVQERISTANIIIGSQPVTLPASGKVDVNITVEVISGTSMNHTWSTNATHQSSLTGTFLLVRVTQEGYYNVQVVLSNAINTITASKVFQVIAALSDLQISCSQKTLQSGQLFLRNGDNYDFTATTATGISLSITWNFGDSTLPQTGSTVSHNYTTNGQYTLSVVAVNAVSPSATASLVVNVEDVITAVNLINWQADWLQNKVMSTKRDHNLNSDTNATFKGEVTPSSMQIHFEWKPEQTASTISTTSDIFSYNYTEPGLKNITVKACNTLNCKNAYFIFYAIKNLTSITVSDGATQLTESNIPLQVNKAHTFTISSGQTVPDTVTYLIRIRTSTSSIYASSRTDSITFTLPDYDTYTFEAYIENSIGIIRKDITLEVIHAVSGVTITAANGEDGIISSGGSITLSASARVGLYLTYLWQYASAPNGEVFPPQNTGEEVTLTPTTLGMYNVTVYVSNPASASPVSAIYVVSVLEGVSGVRIDASLPHTNAVLSGSTYTFTAVYTTGTSPVYYAWKSIRDGLDDSTSTQSTFTINFIYQAIYNISLVVSNNANNVSVSQQISSLNEVSNFTLVVNGATHKPSISSFVTNTGSTLSFVSSLSSYQYISLDWKLNSTSIGSGQTLQYTFQNNGSYTVSLNASNLISSQTRQVSIIIQTAVTGVTVTNCGGTFLIGSSVVLTVKYTAGTSVTTTWSGQSLSTSIGTSVTARFTTTGKFNITATTGNYLNSIIKVCTMIVQDSVGNLVLTASQYKIAKYNITFTVTGSNLNDVIYSWSLAGHKVNTTVPTIDHIFSTAGSYNVNVTVSNAVSSSSATISVIVKALQCEPPQLTLNGASNRIALRSRFFEVAVSVNTSNCNNYTSKYNWTVYIATSCNAQLSSIYPLSINTNTPFLQIVPATLPYGNYCFVFTMCYNNTNVVKSMYINVTIAKSDIVAVHKRGEEAVNPQNIPLELNASPSYDKDEVEGTFKYEWTCTPELASTRTNSICTEVEKKTTATATVDGSFVENDVFNIVVTVSAVSTTADRVSGTASQKITIVPALTPVLSLNLTSSSCVHNTTHVAILGTCESGCTDSTAFQWKIYLSSGASVSLASTVLRTPITNKNFVTIPGALTTSGHKFRLEATESSLLGFATISLPACTSPSSGTCTLTPQKNINTPLDHLVTVSCVNWQVSDKMSGIYYKIMAYSTSTTTNTQAYIVYYGTKATLQVYVSPFGGSSNTRVKLRVYIQNDWGVEVLAVEKIIDFEYPTTNNLDHLVGKMKTDMLVVAKTNDPVLQIQYATAAIQYLNHLSANPSSSLSGSLEARTAVRETLAWALSGIQLVTLQQLLQLASALTYLSKYSEELSLNTLIILGEEINAQAEALKAMVKQGENQNDYKSDNLLEAINQMQTVLQSTIPVSSSATLTSLGSYSSYKLSISRTYTTKTYTSEAARKLDLIKQTLQFSIQLLVVQLQTTAPGESPVQITINGSVYKGYHRDRDNLQEYIDGPGATTNVQPDTLDYTSYIGSSVYQLSAQPNVDPRLSISSSSSLINSKTVQSLFMDTAGNQISVNNLQDSKAIELFMFNANAKSFTVSNLGLVHSVGYNASVLANFTIRTLKRTKSETFTIEMPTETGTAVAVQILPLFTTTQTNGAVTAVVSKNGQPYTSQSTTDDNLKPKTILLSSLTEDHTKYTVFLNASYIDTGAAFSLTLSTNLTTQVRIAVNYYKCLYYDTATNDWSGEGCKALETSIPSVIHCKCTHMTSYGGSLLVSPDEINFVDLTDVDIISNPVAIITCSVVLFIYIVALVACRKMDLLDIKRMSNIPLCGKDGSFKYEVTVVTGRQPGAGTTAHVGIRLIGEYGKTGRQHISKDGAFKRNTSDTFVMAYDVNLGELSKILVWHDNSGLSPSWYLSHIIVYDLQTFEKYYFICQSWLSLEQENGSIQRELKVAGEQDMNRFGYRMKTAMFNALADKHLWLSLFNRPALSRFTRVQRATCCVTLLFTFIGINAMWYGLLKKENTELSWGTFGWEEIVLAIVSNVMLFPISLGIVFLFKKSRPKSNMFEHLQKPQTAQTIEIENLCDNSQGGSFESRNIGEVPFDLERESTIDSVPQAATALHRSRHVRHRENTDDSLATRPRVAVTATSAKSPLWNQDNIMKWPEAMAYNEPDSRPSTSSTIGPTVRQQMVKAGGSKTASGAIQKGKSIKSKEATQQLLDELDDMENELKETESKSIRSSGSKRSLVSSRKASMQKSSSNWGSLEDILNSDDESVAGSSKRMTRSSKRGSVVTTSAGKKFNPRADPRINGNGSHWPKSRESGSTNTGQGESFDHTNTAGITAGLRPGYYSEMTMESRDIRSPPPVKEKCSLPPWCVYIAYIICFLLSVFSVIVVILYCFKFGPDESTEWVLAFLLSLVLSICVIEPFKALLIAVYVVAMFHRVEQEEDEDNINIETTFDNSNEKLKDVKFKPVSGFALLQAKEEGRKIHRMKVMLRQFIAYLFYLWVLMVICYINFKQDTYLLNKYVNNTFVETTTSNYVGYNNISSIDEFWDWSENVLADSLHLQDTSADEEHGFLLGPARWRLIRSLIDQCKASDAASGLGASTLTDRTCYGDGGFEEDTALYGERWNDSSYNRSWRYFTANQLRGSHKVGYVDTYGGGGYTQDLGTTSAETLTIIQDLKYKGFIDLRTRAVVIEFAMYSPGTDMTAMVAMLVEFPLTGGVLTSYEIQSQRLLWFQENRVDPLMVMECILFLVIIYSLVHITLQILEKKKQFFKDVWNWYEMLTTLMTVVSIGIYIGCVVEATNTFNDYLDNPLGFTNFERVAYVHVAMRYLHAWLLFLLMFKVVKQLRFIKFMHVYEKTLRVATGHLLATGLIYGILLLVYAQVGYLMYGRFVGGFETFWLSISTLVVMIRGTFDFWPMLDYHPVFSHFYVYSYYAFAYGIMIALVIAILTSTYKLVKSQMYYKASLEMQDYEMIDFMLKRFKLWAGITKPKPAFRQVRFPGLPSVSSRSSSSYSSRTTSSVQSSQSLTGPEFSQMQLNAMLTRLTPTWQAVLKRFDKIEALEKEEENLVKKAEDTMKDLNLRCRINEFERQHKEILNWKDPSSSSSQQGETSNKQRQSLVKRPPNRDNQTDRKAPATVSGVMSRTAATPPSKEDKWEKERRPLSDQGARAEPATQQRTSTREKVHNFLKSVKPSRPAWNK